MMGPEGPIIALDGPAGAGKSTAARELARRLGYRYVDTGAMYRVVGLLASERGVAADDEPRLATIASTVAIAFEPDPSGEQRVLADGRDVTRLIRTSAAGEWASKVSAVPAVRDHLVRLQREIGARGGAVIEGRDIGTVVFPDADLKFFVEASAVERGERRHRELAARGDERPLDDVLREMEERDRRDSSRSHSPLRRAEDAERVDTTGRSIDEVVAHLAGRVRGLETKKSGE